MGTTPVDQLLPEGSVTLAPDSTLSGEAKVGLLVRALPGAELRRIGGQRYIRFHGQAILYKQITHLGGRWASYKKRIQIPNGWLRAHQALAGEGLRPRFVGIYHYGEVTIFVDFDPEMYLAGKANNSSAHVSTNDLHQALKRGTFARVDKRGNRLTSVRASDLAAHLSGDQPTMTLDPYLELFRRFNRVVLSGRAVAVLDAAQEMYAAQWRHMFQAEWAGFYLEYLLDEYLRSSPHPPPIELVHQKAAHELDFDLIFRDGEGISFLGDVKASDERKTEAPGNDAASLERALTRYGRFWYVIYEHSTVKARDRDHVATVAWNTWRRDVGYVAGSGKGFDPMSYGARLKAEVTFTRMMILEVNEANRRLVLGDFRQGHQPSGDDRALKRMIKKDVDNFIIFAERLG